MAETDWNLHLMIALIETLMDRYDESALEAYVADKLLVFYERGDRRRRRHVR